MLTKLTMLGIISLGAVLGGCGTPNTTPSKSIHKIQKEGIPPYQIPPTQKELEAVPKELRQKAPTAHERAVIEKYLRGELGSKGKNLASPGISPSQPSSNQTQPPPRIGADDSTVKISGTRGMGSGSFISRDGLIVTAAHVAKLFTNTPATIETVDGRKFTATVLDINNQMDIAILKAPKAAGSVPYLILREGQLSKGEAARLLGYSTGRLLSKDIRFIGYLGGGDQDMVFTRGIEPGDSGGPIVDKDENLVGIGVGQAQGVGKWTTSGSGTQLHNMDTLGVDIKHVRKLACSADPAQPFC